MLILYTLLQFIVGHNISMKFIVVLNILMNYVLIPFYGPLGAAIATTLTMVGWNVWAATLVYKFHGVIAVPFLTHIRRDA